MWWRGLGFAIAVILALAFVEKPSSITYTSDPRFRPEPWEPPCGLPEAIEMVCLCIFIVDVLVKVYYSFIIKALYIYKVLSQYVHAFNTTLVTCMWISAPQSYLIGWEEFRMNKWLIGYVLVVAGSVIDCIISFAMLCDPVSSSNGNSIRFQIEFSSWLQYNILSTTYSPS